PLYTVLKSFDLVNSLWALLVAYPTFTVPFCTWLLMGFFRSIPRDLEEAAMVDGATRLGAFTRVILPLLTPGILAAALFAFTLVLHLAAYGLLPVGPPRRRRGRDGGRRDAARCVHARDPPAHDARHPGGRALRVHARLERVPLRARLRAQHRAQDDPRRPERPDVRRHLPLGRADGCVRPDDAARDRPLHLPTALYARGPHCGRL